MMSKPYGQILNHFGMTDRIPWEISLSWILLTQAVNLIDIQDKLLMVVKTGLVD